MSSLTARGLIIWFATIGLLSACNRAVVSPINASPTMVRTSIVVTATPSQTPIPPTVTVTPTPWLEEVKPTVTPLPTLSAEEINVTVVTNEGPPINQHHWNYRNLVEQISRPVKVSHDNGIVDFSIRGYCGDECGFTADLKLQHIADGQLPKFLSYEYKRNDYYSGTEQFQLAEGFVEIESWDVNGIISGRLTNSAGSNLNHPFYFWHDFAKESLFARYQAGAAVTTDALRSALARGSVIEKLDALFVIEQKRVSQPERMQSLVPDLIAAIADTTPIPHNGSNGSHFYYLGNQATFTLSALASLTDGTYFAYREPLTDFTYYASLSDSVETPLPPSAERVVELQANWQAIFDEFEQR